MVSGLCRRNICEVTRYVTDGSQWIYFYGVCGLLCTIVPFRTVIQYNLAIQSCICYDDCLPVVEERSGVIVLISHNYCTLLVRNMADIVSN